HVLGAQFKTKLVIGALVLSLTPVVCMFGFTYGLINRTLDKWFSQPVDSVRDDNQGMLDLLHSFIAENAQDEALSIAASPELQAGLRTGSWTAVRQLLSQRRSTLQGGFAAILDPGGAPLASFNLPPAYRPAPPAPGGTQADAQRLQFGERTYLLARARLAGTGQVEVGMPIPVALTAQMARLAQDRDRYDRMARERRSLRTIYTGYLLLLTLAILFGATWMALYLSKLVTVPVAKLAEATQEISRGNLAYRVQVRPPGGKDEIGLLVDSFNRMAGELETNRAQIDASRQLLQSANQELETRRRYTETLLENTPSAVISLDREHRIERVNPAVQRLFASPLAHPRRLE
ncbi:MAG: HAMP domain-containing protein, partial [Streptosporangiaceae bacterium]